LQEQPGMYGPIVIEPAAANTDDHDRDHVVVLSDWTDEDPEKVFAKLKKRSDYYYYYFNKRTVFDFFRVASKNGWQATAD
jgi:FtsP/CotA-like multicopper oxidase with cupredoxin domain